MASRSLCSEVPQNRTRTTCRVWGICRITKVNIDFIVTDARDNLKRLHPFRGENPRLNTRLRYLRSDLELDSNVSRASFESRESHQRQYTQPILRSGRSTVCSALAWKLYRGEHDHTSYQCKGESGDGRTRRDGRPSRSILFVEPTTPCIHGREHGTRTGSILLRNVR